MWELSSSSEAAKAVGQACRPLRSLAGTRQLPQGGGAVFRKGSTLEFLQMLVDRRPPHAQYVGDIVGRALALERAFGV